MKAISKILALALLTISASSAMAAELRKPDDGRTWKIIQKCLDDSGFEEKRHFRLKPTDSKIVQINETNIIGDSLKVQDLDRCWDADGDPK